MQFIYDGFWQAIDLLLHPDRDLLVLIKVTLIVALGSAAIAMVLGTPIGLWLGLARFRGRGAFVAVSNAGMGLPPIVVGVVLSLLMFRGSLLGNLRMIYSIRGVIVAQVVLALPLVIAITITAVQSLDPNLLRQAKALGARRGQFSIFALREARGGVYTAAIAAVGAGLSEVGAVVLVGGNIQGQTQTLASSLLVSVSAGQYGRAVAVSLILLGLILILGAAFTAAQQRVPGGSAVRGATVRGR